uniref:Secreted protein n=1 Tax=Panagrellus redivivus TaxID=6233 RepID=A0A7E4V3G6_PANRE
MRNQNEIVDHGSSPCRQLKLLTLLTSKWMSIRAMDTNKEASLCIACVCSFGRLYRCIPRVKGSFVLSKHGTTKAWRVLRVTNSGKTTISMSEKSTDCQRHC